MVNQAINSEVVFQGPELLVINPFHMGKKEQLTLDGYKELLLNTPSLGFNAFQRLYAALRMFGHSVDSHGRRHANWLDDWVDLPGRPLHEQEVYGLEKIADELMFYLLEASTDRGKQGTYFALVGPAGSGKTTLIKSAAKAIDAFSYMKEGAVYTVRWDLSGLEGHFKGDTSRKGLDSIICPAHENPLNILNFLDQEGTASIISDINGRGLPKWQQLYPRTDLCPGCDFVVQKISDAGESIEERVGVVRLYDRGGPGGHHVRMKEFKPTDEKSYDSTSFFGGDPDFSRFQIFADNNHPLVVNYGIGGAHNGNSPQRAVVHFSEMFKYLPPCLNELLDPIQDRAYAVKGRFPVDWDVVILATSNLEEYKVQGVENRSLGEYLTSRGVIRPAPYITVLDDFCMALEKTVFTPGQVQELHLPPHFVRWVMSVLNVVSAITPPESHELDDEGKMHVLNHESPPGLEVPYEVIREQLIREATQRPITELVEGVQRGFPYRFFQQSLMPFRNALEDVEIDESMRDERYRYCLSNLANLHNLLEDYIRSFSGINEETRERALKVALPLGLELWKKHLSSDVNIALMGQKTIESEAAKYLAMVYAYGMRKRDFVDPRTRQVQDVDGTYLGVIDRIVGVADPEHFRALYANQVRFKAGPSESGVLDVFSLARVLLNEDRNFRLAIEKYVIQEVLPRNVNNVSAAYGPENTELRTALVSEFGYCNSCAPFAISAASAVRKLSERDR